jgi:hypothetical protein
MLDRARLHELVDNLPEAAITLAQGALEHMQTWPPSEPPQVRAIKEARLERMRQSMRPGAFGGAHYRMGPGGRVEYGHQSHSHWESDAVVTETHRFHAGLELVIEERLRLDNRMRMLIYTHEITGPDGTKDTHEVSFRVPE